MTQSLKENGKPATLWFWDDWFSSFDVRACSLAARGLWIDMLGIMARSEIMGTLTINGKQIDNTTLARIAGIAEAEIDHVLVELEENRVFSRLPDGTIINRRMFNDSQRKEMISKIKAAAGKKGAEARWQTESKPMAEPSKEDVAKAMAKMALPNQSKPIQANKTKRDGRIQGEFDPLAQDETDKKFEEFWSAYPKEGKHAKKESRVKFGALVKRGELPDFVKAFHGYLDFLKHQRIDNNFNQKPLYAKTFLNDRWREFIDFKYEAPL